MIYYDIEYDRVIKFKNNFIIKKNYKYIDRRTKMKYFYNFCNIVIKVYYQ